MRLASLSLALLALAAPLAANPTAIDLYQNRLRAETAQETATAYTVIFDTSGSMKGRKIDLAKQAFSSWLQSVSPGNVWSLYDFNGVHGRLLVPFTLNGQGQVAQTIRRSVADSSTPIVDSLGLARDAILERRKAHPYESHVVLLFTDGEENVDRRGNAAVLGTIRALRNQGIEVVSIGYAGEGDYLRNASSRYYHATDAKALAADLAKVESEIDPLEPVVMTADDLKRISR